MSLNLVTLLYLVASVCFIQALKGLSHPTTSIRGNLFGMVGMAIAVLTTAALIVELAGRMGQGGAVGMAWVLLGLVVGGGYGAWRAKTVEMTKMPELVAFFHSMIGLAAVFIAIAAAVEPWAFGITGQGRRDPHRQPARTGARCGHRRDHLQRLGDRLRQALGHLQVPPVPGRAGACSPGQHLINAVLGLAMLALIVGYTLTQSNLYFGLMLALAFVIGVTLIIPIGGADMPVVVSHAQQLLGLGGGGHRLLAEQRDADHRRLAGRQLGRDPLATSCARR